MSDLIQVFIDVVTALYTFVSTNLIPATAADVNIIHVAIWTPVVIGLIKLVVSMIKGFWARRASAS